MATLLLMALALAAQPWSVLAGIILVATRGGLAKEVAYVVGWIAALTTVMAITVAMAPDTPSTSGSTATAAAEIGLGLLLAGFLAVRWRRTTGTTAPTPSWMGRLDTMPWILALVLGAFLPNYFIVVAAATEMLQIGLTGASLAVVGVVFVLVASLGVAAPLAVLVARRDQATRRVRRVAHLDPGEQPDGDLRDGRGRRGRPGPQGAVEPGHLSRATPGAGRPVTCPGTPSSRR